MSKYTSHTAIEPTQQDGVWVWTLTEPLVWELGDIGSGFTITAPVGFSTDLGTIPSWLRWLLNPADPQCAKAYILHDWVLKSFGVNCQFFAVSQLYEAMRADGVPAWKRVIHYFGVLSGIDVW